MQPLSVNQYLRQHIRTVPDWPAPGVQFRDITPLLQDPKVFRVLIDAFVHRYMDKALRPDAVKAGDRVLLIDDLIATGGTMMAGKKLLEKLGATVTEGAAIVDLPELGGSQRLRDAGLPLYTLVDFAGH